MAQPGQMLNQMIFRQGKTLISDDDLMALHRETPIVSGEPVIPDGLGFSVDLRPEWRPGWVPRQAAYWRRSIWPRSAL